MSWIFHSIADEMVRTVNALRMDVGLKILTAFLTKCNDSLTSSPEHSCSLSTARNPFTSRVSECLPHVLFLTWSCPIISLIANWLIPGLPSALSGHDGAWCDVLPLQGSVGSSAPENTKETTQFSPNVPLYLPAYVCTNSAFWFILLFTSHARKQTREWTWSKSFTHCRFKVSSNDYTL